MKWKELFLLALIFSFTVLGLAAQHYQWKNKIGYNKWAAPNNWVIYGTEDPPAEPFNDADYFYLEDLTAGDAIEEANGLVAYNIAVGYGVDGYGCIK